MIGAIKALLTPIFSGFNGEQTRQAKISAEKRMPDTTKNILIIADPNGAGKTTFAHAFLAQSNRRFINADLIAAGLSPFAPESKPMNTQTPIPANTIDIQAALAAFRRAAELARKTAIETNTHIVVMEDDQIVHISAERLRQQQKV